MTRLTSLLVLALASCAHVTPECPTHGGETWRELSSAHFVVHTNLGPEAAGAAALELERARTALLPSFLGVPTPARPLEVVLFRSVAQLEDVTFDALRDGSIVHDWRGPVMVISSDGSLLESTPQLRLMLHELAHHYSGQALRRRPRWLSEGLSEYLETITLDADSKMASRGVPNQERLGEVLRWGLLPVDSLWAWDELHDERPGLEAHRLASAWFWVHYLFNEQRAGLEKFFAALGEGQEPRRAWGEVFPLWTEKAMSDAAAAYVERRNIHTQRIELGVVSAVTSQRVMTDAQVHALLARLAASTGRWVRARAETDAGLALDPNEPGVREQQVVLATSRVEAARQLVAAQPTLGSGWLLLALALPEAPERTAALEQALVLEPDAFLALVELASRRCAEGRCAEGLALARRAVGLAPDDVRVVASAAAVMAKGGACAEAVSAQRHALELVPHGAPDAVRARLSTGLGVIRRDCPAP